MVFKSLSLVAYCSIVAVTACSAPDRGAGHTRASHARSATRSRRATGSKSRAADLLPVSTTIRDSGGRALIVRLLDVGQGDATYIRNGESRVVIDGGPDEATFGRYLDSLNLNNSTIDVVVLSHEHYDHYNGLLALFESARHIKVRYFFENKDPATAVTLARLRDSIIARTSRDGLIYRDTDDPCANGSAMCTITLTGGAKMHILRPMPGDGHHPRSGDSPNNRSAVVKLIGPDSASFTMWLAGDAEHEEIGYFERAGYAQNPGMRVNVLKADHHGSCNGVTPRYLQLLKPDWVVASLGAVNDYGHMHEQAKATYAAAGVPWYRTDQNGTVTIRSPGTPRGGYTISVERGAKDMSGPSDRVAHQAECAGM